MKKTIALLLAMLLVLSLSLGSLVGCGASKTEAPSTVPSSAAPASAAPSAEGKQITIGVITKIIDPFFNKCIDGAVAHGTELGCKVISAAASNTTAVEEQIAIVQDMISKKVDAILIVPIDSKALVPVIADAIKAGIAVVNFDNQFDKATVAAAGLDPIPFVGIDNESAAYMSAAYLVKAMNGTGKVAILEGVRGADNATLRKNGAERAFKEAAGIELVASQSANWNAEEGYSVFSNILQANPDITGLFASCDAMSFGAMQAIEAAGLSDKIKIAAFDADDAAIINIRDGKTLCTVDQNPKQITAKAVDVALDMLKGIKPEEHYSVDAILVTTENAGNYNVK